MGELLRGAFPAAIAAPGSPPAAAVRLRPAGPAGGAAAPALMAAGELAPRAPLGWDQRRRLWWLLWASCPGLGPVRLAQLEASLGGFEAAWAQPLQAFASLPGWPAGLLGALEQHRQRWGSDPLPRFASSGRAGRAVLLPGDPRWPAGLRRLPRPPLLLHWQGRGSLWSALAASRAVAVVGTRRPSSHGLSVARRLGAALAEAGWPVLSGLAEGIDGEAHRGCLEAGGAPVAVLGTPLDRVYPRHHASLQRNVGRSGLLISEHASGSGVRPGHFATRNRLLVAMAAAVVVVECPQASGALHSAEVAWQQGLPLWAVPADTGRRSAAGSNRLLSQGAAPLLAAEDLIAQLGAGPLRRPAAVDPARAAAAGSAAGGGPEAGGGIEAAVLAALADAASLEQLMAALAIGSAELSAALLQLELRGQVRAEPGLRWRRC